MREGDFDLAPQVMALVQETVRIASGNLDVLNALTRAYILQAVAATHAGGTLMDALPTIRRAFDDTERVLRIDPDNAEALANHGTVLGMAALTLQKPAPAKTSVEEMYRAVAARDTPTVIEDLSFPIAAAEGNRAGDRGRHHARRRFTARSICTKVAPTVPLSRHCCSMPWRPATRPHGNSRRTGHPTECQTNRFADGIRRRQLAAGHHRSRRADASSASLPNVAG